MDTKLVKVRLNVSEDESPKHSTVLGWSPDPSYKDGPSIEVSKKAIADFRAEQSALGKTVPVANRKAVITVEVADDGAYPMGVTYLEDNDGDPIVNEEGEQVCYRTFTDKNYKVIRVDAVSTVKRVTQAFDPSEWASAPDAE